MIAFEYEPAQWPPERFFDESMTRGQRGYLRTIRDTSMYTPREFLKLCMTILEAYGLQPEFNRGSAEVLMDFYRHARAKNKRLAHQAAFGELPVL